MANNDRLKQTISNLRILSDLASSMIESDIFPVSFFSQAYDLIQKINSDFQTLESEQVELFASQMKKHQTLILSIHQQMRTMSPEPQASGVYEMPEIPEKPLIEKPEAPAPVETSTESFPLHSETPQLEVTPATPLETNTSTPPEEINSVMDTYAEPTETKLADAIVPPSLNDLIEKHKLSDLRKAFSLNDRFHYRRELFGGNEEAMNKVIHILNNKDSFKESVLFLEEKLHWDFSNPTVKDFVKKLELRFL